MPISSSVLHHAAQSESQVSLTCCHQAVVGLVIDFLKSGNKFGASTRKSCYRQRSLTYHYLGDQIVRLYVVFEWFALHSALFGLVIWWPLEYLAMWEKVLHLGSVIYISGWICSQKKLELPNKPTSIQVGHQKMELFSLKTCFDTTHLVKFYHDTLAMCFLFFPASLKMR